MRCFYFPLYARQFCNNLQFCNKVANNLAVIWEKNNKQFTEYINNLNLR